MILTSHQWKLGLRKHGILDKLSSLPETETLKLLFSPGERIFVVKAKLIFYSAFSMYLMLDFHFVRRCSLAIQIKTTRFRVSFVLP